MKTLQLRIMEVWLYTCIYMNDIQHDIIHSIGKKKEKKPMCFDTEETNIAGFAHYLYMKL